ncbi:MAG: ABC transporter ATP-binding protein [Bdellovibrionales bacterium]|jgi:putative ABC transport system ATP-binding protein|nr:ABC transporter ATP-binding protein [Bdellovibrionales bacterium]
MKTIVEFINVVKSYQLGDLVVPALRGLNLKVFEGEFTVLIGSSGSGKTTVLNLVGCIDDPDSGEILIDGNAIRQLTENQKSELRNKKIGFIFQSFNLIPVLNVEENIEMPLLIQREITMADRKQRVKEALADVGLSEFRTYMPNKLSGGQRQRVAIARALVSKPQLVLADEPTANLDSKTAHMIIDLLTDLNKRKKVTFLFCSHDEKLIGRVGRVLRIQDGLIVEGLSTQGISVE